MSKPPKKIWLVPGPEAQTWTWCDDPAPSPGMDEKDAVRYIRDDTGLSCPDCGGVVKYYHEYGGVIRVVCNAHCKGWKVIKEINL